MLYTAAVRNCIRENRIYEIPNIIETSRRYGMHTMDNSIAQLCLDGYIDKEEAILRSNNRSKMEKSLDYARRA
jgi:twitching motility protein PilT